MQSNGPVAFTVCWGFTTLLPHYCDNSLHQGLGKRANLESLCVHIQEYWGQFTRVTFKEFGCGAIEARGFTKWKAVNDGHNLLHINGYI